MKPSGKTGQYSAGSTSGLTQYRSPHPRTRRRKPRQDFPGVSGPVAGIGLLAGESIGADDVADAGDREFEHREVDELAPAGDPSGTESLKHGVQAVESGDATPGEAVELVVDQLQNELGNNVEIVGG